jgi:EAL domain-containing protein (putative c-di-GMP-specific phosphodiesterase class I)
VKWAFASPWTTSAPGMMVVGEGVETIEERDALAVLGCDLLQGYFFAKPGRPFPEVAL